MPKKNAKKKNLSRKTMKKTKGGLVAWENVSFKGQKTQTPPAGGNKVLGTTPSTTALAY